MHRPRRAPAWIAAFAVLLHLFAMPLMAGHMQGKSGAGRHCPMTEAAQAHTGHQGHAHATEQQAPDPGHHQGMPCCCAAGSASLAAISTGSTHLLAPRLLRIGSLVSETASPLAPRYRWPSLNPRASPLS